MTHNSAHIMVLSLNIPQINRHEKWTEDENCFIRMPNFVKQLQQVTSCIKFRIEMFISYFPLATHQSYCIFSWDPLLQSAYIKSIMNQKLYMVNG